MTTTEQEIQSRSELTTAVYAGKPFIPAWLDDLDLSPIEFRLYAHMIRRVSFDGIAWPAHRSIAAKCHVERETVALNLERLVQRGLPVPVKKDRRGHITYGLRYKIARN